MTRGRALVALLALVALGVAGARGQAAGPAYRVYVANESSDLVTRVVFVPGAGARVEARVPVGVMPGDNDGAHGIAVSPDGAYWYVTVAHGTPFGSVWKFAAGADTLVGRTELGHFPATMGLTPEGQFMLAANFNLHGDPVPSDVSLVYLPDMLELARIQTCVMPHGSRVRADGAKHYSVCMHSDQLVEIDLLSFQVSGRFSLTPGAEGTLEAPRGDPDAGVGVHGAHAPPAAGVGSGGATVCAPTWAEPAAGARAGRIVYVTCNRSGEILEIDTGAWRVIRRFHTGGGPYNLEVTPDGRALLATLKGGRAVAVIDLEAGAERARISTSRPVTHGVVVSPDGRYAFVTNEAVGSTRGTLDVIDLATDTIAATLDLELQPGGIDFWSPPGD